jgi:tetraprenyl-beta-curcumene synthase
MHAVPALGTEQLQEWATGESEGTGLQWRELLAGAASSVLVLHALIAAAADPRTTPDAAARIAEAYLSTCVLLTVLDGLVDYEHDTSCDGPERPGYLNLFEDPDELSDVLVHTARRAAIQARALPNRAHHVMILVGVVAYYSSEPGADGELARPVVTCLRRELAPLMSPTVAVMRAWRSTKRRARSFATKGEGESYHETSAERGTAGSPRCCG